MLFDSFALYKLLCERAPDRMIGALFDWYGKRLEGDERLEVKLHRGSGEEAGYWWYHVLPLENFQFIHFPSNSAAVIETYAASPKGDYENTYYFRYVSITSCLRGAPLRNLDVNFLVFAYKFSDLHLSSQRTSRHSDQ
jgi:hypothetical protein